MEQQQAPVQAVGVLLLLGDNTVQDGLGGDKVRSSLTRAVGGGMSPGGMTDGGKKVTASPLGDLQVVLLARGQKVAW